MDLGFKVMGWDKPELLGEASREQSHPAVPVRGQGPLATQKWLLLSSLHQHSLIWVQPLGETSPGRGHQDDLPLEKWHLKEFWLKRADQTYLTNDQPFLVVFWRFMNSKPQAKQPMNILDMVLTLPTLFSYPNIFLTHIILKLFSVTFIIASFIRISLLGMKR